MHTTQVFVANPDKPSCINDILLRRREKLLEFLARFHPDRSEDEQFNDEKAYLIKHIKVGGGLLLMGLVRVLLVCLGVGVLVNDD